MEPGLSRSVQGCWASLFEPQAIAYRERRAIDHLDVGIAVVVQQMVQSRRSGVMFTVHPVTGVSDKVVIEAVYGLGEACVSGVVTPDFYVVDKRSLTLEEKAVSHQDMELIRDANASPGDEANEWRSITSERAGAQKLSDEEIARVAAVGCRVEDHYGAPQDIEWAECDGEFYIVQARPVTTLA
jgi:pyruvate,water dikinase